MECTVREFDRAIIRGLKSDDPNIHSRCVKRIFYEDLVGLLRSIQMSVFKGTVDYDELVNELYIFLAKNGWKILDSFKGRNGASLATWLSHVTWRFFLYSHKRMGRLDYYDDITLFSRPIETVTEDEMRMDIQRTLSRMPNKRYVRVIQLLVMDGRETEEVAKIMDTTVQNLYNLKHRAIAQFLDIYR